MAREVLNVKALDLFCGLGGWSEGFQANGFECVGVDIVDVGYPYQLILQDVRTLDGKRFEDFDVIIGNPPCRDFSCIGHIGKYRWKDPPNPQRGLELVDAFLRIVDEARPRFWLMENVPQLREHLAIEPEVTARLAPTMKRSFWGEFPMFLVPMTERSATRNITGKHRAWKRAKIPFAVSDALAKAISMELKSR